MDSLGRSYMLITSGSQCIKVYKLTNITLHSSCRHVTSDHSSNLRDVARGLLYNDHVIAHSISVLKKQRRATTFDIALSHDGNPITENVCFVHKVSGEKNSPAFLMLL